MHFTQVKTPSLLKIISKRFATFWLTKYQVNNNLVSLFRISKPHP